MYNILDGSNSISNILSPNPITKISLYDSNHFITSDRKGIALLFSYKPLINITGSIIVS